PASCSVETGYLCSGSPSVCSTVTVCGDGILNAEEECDDRNTRNGDGCTASCSVETGYVCSGSPSFCSLTNSCPQLYNKIVSAWQKSCSQTGYNPVADIDKNKQVGTSDYALYSSNYKKIGWCQQQLSNTTDPCLCGNGLLNPSESCDDRNTRNGDGCSASCSVETGYVCSGSPSTCHRAVTP
ncbi:MAG: DUF4215 domain-containing protein, partial [Candidatus Peribacteraceae bacterium]|nr:DUF4215 domain-containing protein [Candidatus Peribacteraceae bacterium]